MWLLWLGEQSKKAVQFAVTVGAFPRWRWPWCSLPKMWVSKLFGGLLEGLRNSPFPSFFNSICDCALCEINILRPLFQFWLLHSAFPTGLHAPDNCSTVCGETSTKWAKSCVGLLGKSRKKTRSEQPFFHDSSAVRPMSPSWPSCCWAEPPVWWIQLILIQNMQNGLWKYSAEISRAVVSRLKTVTILRNVKCSCRPAQISGFLHNI